MRGRKPSGPSRKLDQSPFEGFLFLLSVFALKVIPERLRFPAEARFPAEDRS